MRRVFGWILHAAGLAGWGYFEVSLIRQLVDLRNEAGFAPIAFATAIWTWMGWPLLFPSKKEADYETRNLTAGGIVITRSASRRRERYGRFVRMIFIEFGFFAWAIAKGSFPRDWLFLLGIVSALAAIGYFFEDESWHVAPSWYEHRRTIFGWTYSRRRVDDQTLILDSSNQYEELVVRAGELVARQRA